MSNQEYYIGTVKTLTLPAPVTDPPDCGSLNYSIDGGAASAVFQNPIDPSVLDLTLFYDNSPDLSDPEGLGSMSHSYTVKVTVQDSKSGLEDFTIFELTIKNPCPVGTTSIAAPTDPV